MPTVDFRFYLITDRKLCNAHSLEDVVKQALTAGVRAVQLREKDLPDRELYELANQLRTLSSRLDAKLFINDRADIVLAVEADGVHCPEQGLPIKTARMLLRNSLIGVSTHSLESALAAELEGADFITFGPIYTTRSKAQYGHPQGIDRLEELVSRVKLPVFAIGGITPERANECLKHGAFGVAAISAVITAENIPKILDEFREALGAL